MKLGPVSTRIYRALDGVDEQHPMSVRQVSEVVYDTQEPTREQGRVVSRALSDMQRKGLVGRRREHVSTMRRYIEEEVDFDTDEDGPFMLDEPRMVKHWYDVPRQGVVAWRVG